MSAAPLFKIGDRITTHYCGWQVFGMIIDADELVDDGAYFYTIAMDDDTDSEYAYREGELAHYPYTMDEMHEQVCDLSLI